MLQERVAVSESPSYRPDIDGLRALAVVPVVFYHAGMPLFSGGYIGVDVFFVISGFLITGILARQMGEGRYSILDFYRRRVRRIFPALTAVTIATLAAGFLILTPDEFVDLGNTAAAIAVFASNFYFWKSVSYFDAGMVFQPMLHTWSLAVEEQFYIFFPLLLYALHGRRRWLVVALATIAGVSFVLSVVLVEWKPSAAFYLLPSRAWELMIGGLLALGCLPRPRTDRAALWASLAGLALILVPIFFYDSAMPFPGISALPPSIGTALVIWAEGKGAGQLLSKAPLVSIGLASYSLYLWHLPIIEFAKYLRNGALSVAAGIALSLVSLGLAYLSLHYIERPFRLSGTTAKVNRQALVAFAGMPLALIAALAVVSDKGAPWRLPQQATLQLAVIGDKDRHPRSCLSVDEKWIDPLHACRLGAAGPRPSVLLWGDSHAMITATALDAAARRMNASFLFVADADCPIGMHFTIDSSVTPNLTRQGHYRRCGEYNRSMLELALSSSEIRTVVLSSRWTNWRIGEPANSAEGAVDVRLRDDSGMARSVGANRAKFEHGFTDLVSALTSAGKHVVIVGPLPEPAYNVPHKLYVSRFGFAEKPRSITITEYERRHAVILDFFKRFKNVRGVSFVWPAKALCAKGACPIVKDGKPVFFDHNHLSVEAAVGVSHLFDKLFAPSPDSSLSATVPLEHHSSH